MKPSFSFWMRVAPLFVLLMILSLSAMAQPGSLDQTFALQGKHLTGSGTADDFGRAAAIQPDGKIVVAGYAVNVSAYAFAVARYNPDGSLDPTFNASGEVFTSFSNYASAYAVAIQPDGKIVVAGSAPSGNCSNNDFAVVRYNPDGSLDTAFNSSGIVTTPIGAFSGDGAYALAIQAHGKIVAAGDSFESGKHNFAVGRDNPDGSLDLTFNQTGKIFTAIGNAEDVANAVAIQTDGKIVAAGYTCNCSAFGGDYDFAAVRYNTDGSLDTSFGSTGKVITRIGPGNDVAYAVAIQSDSKIVVAGHGAVGSSHDFALVRYNTDGSLDSTFNGTGKVTTDFPDPFNPINDYAHAVAIQADGKIVAAGMSGQAFREDFAVARYNANGSL